MEMLINMNHIILIGLPNSGKTTLGKRVAKVMNIPFYDTDKMAVDKIELVNPAEVFLPSFQQRFYEELQNVIIDITSLKVPAIIATGAEIPLIPKCALLLQKMGTVILIKRDVRLMLEDVSKRTHRLILKDEKSGLEIDMSAKAVEEYAKEIETYEKVAHKVFENNGDEESAVTEFTEFLKELNWFDVIGENG
jgi:shikimate kinase